MKERIVVATNNKNKLREIREILGDKFDLASLADVGLSVDAEETGTTFYENALIKAKAVSNLSGAIALADDSGLEVDALGGAPGVYSARYAGEPCDNNKNNDKLLDALKNVEDAKRTARFTSCVVLYFPDGKILKAEGHCNGIITRERKGNCGFGYDPIFFSEDLGKTFGEATDAEKNTVSHRARALLSLAEQIK